MDPAAEEEGAGGAMFPIGDVVDDPEVPGVGMLKATMINAGIPTKRTRPDRRLGVRAGRGVLILTLQRG